MKVFLLIVLGLIGIFFLAKPKVIWKFKYLLSVSGGEPTKEALIFLRLRSLT